MNTINIGIMKIDTFVHAHWKIVQKIFGSEYFAKCVRKTNNVMKHKIITFGRNGMLFEYNEGD